jgi:hypothetical protein
MFADADHEVIDSPEALFRHLYEEHGVEEARDLDPDSAPLQFWLRRHADLERAQRAARRQPDAPPTPSIRPEPETRSSAQRPREPEVRSPAQRPPEPEARTSSQRPREPDVRSSVRRGRDKGRGRAESRREAPPPFPPSSGRGPVRPDGAGAGRSDGAGAGRDGRRHAGFGDPLIEAVARALAGRGYDEAVVRSAIRSFAAGGREPSGEAAVRTVFVEPMLQSAAEHLLDAPGTSRPADTPGPFPASERRRPVPEPARPQPAPAASARPASRPEPDPAAPARAAVPDPDPAPAPASPPRREESVRPEAAWAVLWADLADSGPRPGEGAGSGGDDGDDLMAVANAVQARRRVRLLRR